MAGSRSSGFVCSRSRLGLRGATSYKRAYGWGLLTCNGPNASRTNRLPKRRILALTLASRQRQKLLRRGRKGGCLPIF